MTLTGVNEANNNDDEQGKIKAVLRYFDNFTRKQLTIN